MSNHILVLEGEKPAAYASIRSLHSAGCRVTSASHLKINISRFSKYANKFVACPDIDQDMEGYKNWLLEEIKNGKYLTVFSFSDKTTRLLSENKTTLSAYTHIYQPDINTVDTVLDKSKTYQLAKSLGMNLPEVHETKGKKIDQLAAELSFPLVLRPKQKNFLVNGKIKYYKVTSENYFWSRKDLLKKLPKFYAELDKYDLMSYIDGVGRGYFTIVDGQKTYGNFAHERMREYPVSGGASSARKSIPFEEIKATSLPLINTLNWSGPIMIEYKYNPKTNKYYLIEVNGRWWGSLPLAIHAGIDFPKLLVGLINKEKITAEDFDNYKIGFTSRLLIPHDLMWFFSCLAHGKFNLLPSFFTRADKEDIFDGKDMGAYIAYIISLFGQLKFFRI